MSFIISKGYAKVQILKTSESDPFSFWNILICICPNSETKIKLKMTLHIFICKKKKKKKKRKKKSADTLINIIFLCVT